MAFEQPRDREIGPSKITQGFECPRHPFRRATPALSAVLKREAGGKPPSIVERRDIVGEVTTHPVTGRRAGGNGSEHFLTGIRPGRYDAAARYGRIHADALWHRGACSSAADWRCPVREENIARLIPGLAKRSVTL